MEIEDTTDRVVTSSFLAVLVFIGTLGNSLTIYIYALKYKPKSPFTTFTICLAIIDLLTCTLVMPGDILDLLYPYDLFSEIVCKIYRFIASVLFFCSVFCLLVISIDRYRRVCQPLKEQIGNRLSIKLCILAIIIGIIASTPVLYIQGSHTTTKANVTVATCFISDEAETTSIPVLFALFLFFVFLSTLVALAYLYISIYRVIKSRLTRKHKRTAKVNPTTISNLYTVQTDVYVTQTEGADKTRGTHTGNLQSQESSGNARERQSSASRHKLLLFFSITVVFVCAYFPYLVVAFCVLIHDDFRSSMTTAGLTFYRLAFRFIFVHNVTNIVIYLVFDAKFRTESKNILTICK